MFEKRNIQIGEYESGSPIWYEVDSADLISKLLASRPEPGLDAEL